MGRPYPPYAADRTDDAPIRWISYSRDFGVLQLREAVTWPGPVLELHVMRSQAEGLVAWWSTASGRQLGWVHIGQA